MKRQTGFLFGRTMAGKTTFGQNRLDIMGEADVVRAGAGGGHDPDAYSADAETD
jgi:hypothetical protein